MDKQTQTQEAARPDLPFINRELSWLAFNFRVLQEAEDKSVPLLERIKFLAIFSANLDEYFKVRVATLKRLIKLKKKTRQQLEDDPADTFEQVIQEVRRQQEAFGRVFREGILPDLRRERIHLLTENDLNPAQQQWVKTYFTETLQPLLLPIMLDDATAHLFLKDQTVYLGIKMTGPLAQGAAPARFAMLQVPAKKHGSRFVKLPTADAQRYVMFLDDVIRFCLPLLFSKYKHFAVHAIKVSRDAELDIAEEVSGDLMAKIRKSLKKRETGYPARLLYDPETPPELLSMIMAHMGITAKELVPGSKYHNFRDFFQFPDFNLPALKYKPQPALVHPLLAQHTSILAAMQQQDYLVHYPYQSFDYVLRLFEEAAQDPQVTAVSATLYRVAGTSAIARALVKAAENGKMVTVVVELQARFDEESNMYWAGKLQQAGASVIFGVPDLKVHCKLGLITRNENGKQVNYGYLSTGNYNEDTAKVYADHALFTTDKRITADVEQVFSFFMDRQPGKTFKHLLVAPINMRERFEQLIDREIEHAQQGLPAGMILKMNALQDERMIRKLYAASQAGVSIKLLVRGICCLQPGVQGLSENIEVRSIVDRYLEHARVYIFHNKGEEQYYIASADWMTRNLNRRVEVAFPLLQQNLKEQVRTIIGFQLADNTKARTVDNSYLRSPAPGSNIIRSQYATYAYLCQLVPASINPAQKPK